MKKLGLLLILIPLLFMFSCALPFVDRSAGHAKLNSVDWKNKNIIILLGMRSERSGQEFVIPKFAELRVKEAERLYLDCKLTGKVCLILVSGGDPANNGITEAELMKRELLKKQIPETHILKEDRSVSTFHNAKYSSELLSKESPDLTVLVTSDVHLPRALKMFKFFGVFPLPAPAETPRERSEPL